MFEGKTLPIDFKMALYLRDQAEETLKKMNAAPGKYCTNGVRVRLQIWQSMASLLCPGHVFKETHGENNMRVCEVCGSKEDNSGKPLDYWLKKLYIRDCYNCENNGVEDGDSTPYGIGSVRLSEHDFCLAEQFAEPGEDAEKLLKAIKSGQVNCPYWTGKKD